MSNFRIRDAIAPGDSIAKLGWKDCWLLACPVKCEERAYFNGVTGYRSPNTEYRSPITSYHLANSTKELRQVDKIGI